MYKVAIVEDEAHASDILVEYLKKYSTDHAVDFAPAVFPLPMDFLNNYKPIFDLVFMDIRLPGIDGLEAAKSLRKIDQEVPIIFVTNLAQYAINGYEVNAFDFVLKPVSYPRFETLLNKITKELQKKDTQVLVIKTVQGFIKLKSSDVIYITIEDHLLIYHTQEKDYETWNSLKNAEAELPKDSFARANKSIIVNLKHIRSIKGNHVEMPDGEIELSPGKKADFVRHMEEYLTKIS
jgi:two-component system response regulator LytT